MTPVNWKRIFLKYVGAVIDAEGVDFLEEHRFTADEWFAIQLALTLTLEQIESEP